MPHSSRPSPPTATRTRPVDSSSCCAATRIRPRSWRRSASATASRRIARFKKAFHGFAAKLDARQKRDLLADPNVVALVPDEAIHLTAQTVPTGVARVGGLLNPIADIDGNDDRVDADVAITDTGLNAHPDLNVAGGYNCATSDRTAWRDKNYHGTHVAGTIGALDNGIGVVGVAPGARVWGVRILNDQGDGLISWYLCGLDWILAQRDPNDASRPLFEAVNMSVTKSGRDDQNCGFTNGDLLHRAICRVVAGGITVVAAAANDSHSATLNIPASYDEAITVSALADTDGIPGGLGGNKCISFGGYDKDDTFADFSNYGYDVDIMAPGKCILSTIPGGYASMSGTSMSTPTVVGAVALYKESRPRATPSEVREALRYLGNQNWNVATDPDSTHEPLLDVSRIGPLGTFGLTPGGGPTPIGEGGSRILVPVGVARSETFFERVTLSLTSLPAGWTGVATINPIGWTANEGQVGVTPPPGANPGTYQVGIRGTNQGRSETITIPVQVVEDNPTASPPTSALITGTRMGTTTTPIRVSWPAATDPSSAITMYQLQQSLNDGPWGNTLNLSGTTRSATLTVALDQTYRFRVRAMDAGGHWSPWAEVGTSRFHAYDDRDPRLVKTGSWIKVSSTKAFAKTVSSAKTRERQPLDVLHRAQRRHPCSKEPLPRPGPDLPRQRPGRDRQLQVDVDAQSAVRVQPVHPGRRDAHDQGRPDRSRQLSGDQGRRHRRGALTPPNAGWIGVDRAIRAPDAMPSPGGTKVP